MARICIFGAGPGGLYVALRLLQSGSLCSDDTLELFDWGNYRFHGEHGSRAAAGRICTYHHRDDPTQSYIEVGGMRYIEWDETPKGSGHRLVSTMIRTLGLQEESVPFNTTDNPLFFLRGKNFYSSDISETCPAPYNTPHAAKSPDDAFTYVADQAIQKGLELDDRAEQCRFYSDGRLSDTYRGVFEPGQRLRDIGYWNLLYDVLGNEGYRYADMGGGYESNVINWHSADALIYNSEFAPGGTFKTLRHGYSTLFARMFAEIEALSKKEGAPRFHYHANHRLHSITAPDGRISFRTATAEAPYVGGEVQTADKVVLALPPESLELVAQATRYANVEGDLLNAPKVALYRDSVIKQPSYKVAMFFSSPWWENAKYPPRLVGSDPSATNVFGPTITDLPIRQVYYFGNNSPSGASPAVYALLASYDDESFTSFWQELEIGPNRDRLVPVSQQLQPLHGPRHAPEAMVRMLRGELARVHHGPDATLELVPTPLETVFMDWSQKPFGAGYHAWAAHYDICDVMANIRKPSRLVEGLDAEVYIVGSAYSNDQAWVEGAFCTAESVLNDFFGVAPIIDPANYPFICR